MRSMGSGANEIITITSLVHSLENIVDPYHVVRHNLGLYIISPIIRIYGMSGIMGNRCICRIVNRPTAFVYSTTVASSADYAAHQIFTYCNLRRRRT